MRRRSTSSAGASVRLMIGFFCAVWMVGCMRPRRTRPEGHETRAHNCWGQTQPARRLASDASRPRWLTVDHRNVYWMNDHELVATPKLGGTSRVLADGITTPERVASDGWHVYWLDAGLDGADGKLSRVPVEGGTVEVLATDIPTAHALAVDEEFVYWTVNDHLMRQAKKGAAAAQAITAHAEIRALTADDFGVYWANAPRDQLPWIAMVGASGRSYDLVSDSAPGISSSLAVGDSALCWTSWASDPLENGIFCFQSSGAAPQRVAQANARTLSVSNRLLFWIRERAADRAELVCTPLDGGASAVLAAGQIVDLAADPVGVYYADARGAVFAQDLVPQ